MTRKLIVSLCAVACLSIAGCGESLNGKYEAADSNGMLAVEFKSGKAYVTMVGMTTETDYEVKDGKVIFKKPGDKENLVMTIEKDGTLTGGPLGLTLKKKS